MNDPTNERFVCINCHVIAPLNEQLRCASCGSDQVVSENVVKQLADSQSRPAVVQDSLPQTPKIASRTLYTVRDGAYRCVVLAYSRNEAVTLALRCDTPWYIDLDLDSEAKWDKEEFARIEKEIVVDIVDRSQTIVR